MLVVVPVTLNQCLNNSSHPSAWISMQSALNQHGIGNKLHGIGMNHHHTMPQSMENNYGNHGQIKEIVLLSWILSNSFGLNWASHVHFMVFLAHSWRRHGWIVLESWWNLPSHGGFLIIGTFSLPDLPWMVVNLSWCYCISFILNAYQWLLGSILFRFPWFGTLDSGNLWLLWNGTETQNCNLNSFAS